MNLSNELISQFVKATKDTKKTSTESTVNGTTVVYEGRTYVKLDGSDLLTPVNTTTDTKSDERVTVMIKDHTATITGNLSSPAARTEDVQQIGNQITEVEILVADKVSTKELEAESARIDTLVTENVTIREQLTANQARIDDLTADNVTINEKLTAQEADIKKLDAEKLSANAADIKFATIESLEAIEGEFHTLESTYGEFQELTANNFETINATINNLDSTYASIEDLEAEQARIDILEATTLTADSAEIKNLQADVADIDTLIFGSASGTTIQTSFANAVIAQLGNAQIKSAMIENISADKILAGDIITNNVRVMSEDGKLLISDETIQISDDSRVRVQIGKDAAGDYSISIWDADGNLMFSEGGITDSAIKDAIIRNDMVAADANIAASKLDISSLFTEINGSTETINSSKILMDAENQTLDVAFTKMSSDINDLSDDVSSQDTAISVVQGQIASRVWQQDINTAVNGFGDELETLTTKQSSLEQTVDGLSVTVSDHTTQIANKADSSTVAEVSDKVSELEVGLNGFKTTVGETYATKTDLASTDTKATNAQKVAEDALADVETLTNTITTTYVTKSELTQTSESITTSVSETYATKTDLASTDTKATNAQNAADLAQNGVDDLSLRMGSAETIIEQTSESLALMATKEEIAQTLDGYYTKDETDAAIDLKADEINISVDSKINSIQIGGRNLLTSESAEPELSNNTYIHRNLQLHDFGNLTPGETYTISFQGELPEDSDTWYLNAVVSDENDVLSYPGFITVFTLQNGRWYGTGTCPSGTNFTGLNLYATPLSTEHSENTITSLVKLEKGNKATDWTPAPEDLATAQDVESIDENITSVAESVSELNVKADNIFASVTEIRTSTEASINSVNANIETLTNEVSTKMTSEAVEIQIQTAMANGTTKVVTETGFTFDSEGMTIEKAGSEMKTQITEDGMTVYQNEEAMLTANNQGVDARNLHATTYLIVGGRSRFENYGDNRTGCFWIGE